MRVRGAIRAQQKMPQRAAIRARKSVFDAKASPRRKVRDTTRYSYAGDILRRTQCRKSILRCARSHEYSAVARVEELMRERRR